MTPHFPITDFLGDAGAIRAVGSGAEASASRALSPGALRCEILRQHERIRALLDTLEEKATRLLSSVVPRPKELKETRHLALVLCSVMASHIDFENRTLAPTLERIDAWGPVRARRLRQEHEDQLWQLQAFARSLRRRTQSGAELAASAWELVMLIREDMEHEEEDFLAAGLLSDVVFANDVETG